MFCLANRIAFFSLIALVIGSSPSFAQPQGKTCTLRPLGHGKDDTTQIEAAIERCGHFGTTIFEKGNYNVTRKMTWDLVSSRVELNGWLNYPANIDYWMKPENTYRVIVIQSQASWWVVTGSDFVIDAHNIGGIQGNGQPWWSEFEVRGRFDGDGRPVALTVFNATRGLIKDFRIESPPFWSNAVSQSSHITYDGMFVNATNEDPTYFGKNVVWNTDGINTYRSDHITMTNWDITCGDDCLAFKGNSTNIVARNILCRGGNGITFGSLGQYANLVDYVLNVTIDGLRVTRLDPLIQPYMASAIYFKTWSGTVFGSPPVDGGAGTGLVDNVIAKNIVVDRADVPLQLFQTNRAHEGDLPSKFKFHGLHMENWSGTANTNKLVDLRCSPASGCTDVTFKNYRVNPPAHQAPSFVCQNTFEVRGLNAPCNATGTA